MNAIDIQGKQFGEWIVLKRVPKPENLKSRAAYWLCRCSCGVEKVISGGDLRQGKTKSCGHNLYLNLSNYVPTEQQKIEKIERMKKNNPMNRLEQDISGKKYGHWYVIKKDEIKSNKNGIKYICQCDCKNKTIRSVRKSSLLNGTSLSCGCDKESKGVKRIKEILLNNNILFETEKTFFNFEETNRPAYFDFYVNNQYIIEYDGEQHFNCRSSGWNTKEHLIQTQQRDNIKNKWCKDNKIPLIRIPYTHYNDLSLNDLLLETSKFII